MFYKNKIVVNNNKLITLCEDINEDEEYETLVLDNFEDLKKLLEDRNGIIHYGKYKVSLTEENEKFQYWFSNGYLHRENGPAYIDDSGEFWYENGVRIRKT